MFIVMFVVKFYVASNWLPPTTNLFLWLLKLKDLLIKGNHT